MDIHKIALVIGHSSQEQGASNKNGTTEYQYNKELATMIDDELCKLPGFRPIIIERDTYDELPAKINKTNADICLSLHCNAFNTDASGTETLYWEGSTAGRMLAGIVNLNMVSVLGINNRHIKPKKKGDRGAHVLQNTKMSCVILEPFFIDNDSDLEIATLYKPELAAGIANAIRQYWANKC